MKIEKKAIPFYITTIAYAAYIFYLSSKESLEGSGVEVTGFDKANHFMEYSILGFLLMFSLYLTPYSLSLLNRIIQKKRRQDAFIAWTLGSLYGVSDEVHQRFVSGRTFDILDMTADSLGIFTGIVAALIILYLHSRLTTHSLFRKSGDEGDMEVRD